MSAKSLRRLNVSVGTKVYTELTKISVIADLNHLVSIFLILEIKLGKIKK